MADTNLPGGRLTTPIDVPGETDPNGAQFQAAPAVTNVTAQPGPGPTPDLNSIMGTPLVPGTAPPPPTAAAATPEQQQRASARSIVGHAAHSVLSSIYGGEDQKPGQIFRHILAGAILGGAAAEEAHAKNPYMNFGGGMVTGGKAVIQDDREQALLKRKQAQEDFDRQNKVEQQEWERSRAEKLDQASIALTNMQMLHLNKVMQGMDFQTHMQAAEVGKAQLDQFLKAGVHTAYNDVGESQAHQMITQNPDLYNKYMWIPTGVTPMRDKQGNLALDKNGSPNYEQTYSAVPKEGGVATQEMLDLYKKYGMDKYDSNLFKVLKPGKALSADEMVALNQSFNRLWTQETERQKTNLTLEESKQKVQEAIARTGEYKAATAKDYAEAAEAKARAKTTGEVLKQTQLYPHALNEFSKALKDPANKDKTPQDVFNDLAPDVRMPIADHAEKQNEELSRELQTSVKFDDEENAGKASANTKLLIQRIHDNHMFTGLGAASGNTTTKNQPMVQIRSKDGRIAQVSADQVEAFLKKVPGAIRLDQPAPVAAPSPRQLNPEETNRAAEQVLQQQRTEQEARKKRQQELLKQNPEAAFAGGQ